jgi:prepilin-type N-terminal cleavage/methylation domain-containing protein
MVRYCLQLRDRGPRALRAIAGRRGFTLIEIIVVVIVLGIASAIIVPQISSRDDLDASSAARTVMSDLLYAQNRAIATQQYHYVVFNLATQDYSLYSGTPTAPTTLLTHPVYLNNYTMTFNSATNNVGDVTLSSVSFNGQTTIAFDPLGVPYSYNSGVNTALSGTGTVQLTCGAYSLTLSVAQDTGDVTVN